jgi:hypothetical protein
LQFFPFVIANKRPRPGARDNPGCWSGKSVGVGQV